MLTQVIGKLISRVIHDPHPKRAGSSVLDILFARIHYEKEQPNFHGDQTIDVTKIFTRLSTSPTLAKISGDTNADARSVCGS